MTMAVHGSQGRGGEGRREARREAVEKAVEAARKVRATPEGRLASLYLVSETPPGLLLRPLRLLHLPKPLRSQEVLKALEPLRRG